MSISTMATEVSLSRAVPNLTGTLPSITSNPNPLHTPPATGVIVIPTGTIGTAVPVTGRTSSATQAANTSLRNILNVGTTPPPTGSLPTFFTENRNTGRSRL
jgi:hypothetical protein